jgi:hypothetical protein
MTTPVSKTLSGTRPPQNAPYGVYLYRLMDHRGDVIYYGISVWPRDRLLRHLRDEIKGWQICKMQVAVTVEPMARLAALKLESELIKTSKIPLLNVIEDMSGLEGYTVEEAEISTYMPRIRRWEDVKI